jgi:ribosomal protein L11 methyltransferase
LLHAFPDGWEEADRPHAVEIAAYTDAAGEERLRAIAPARATLRALEIADDWEERWRSFHRAVQVGPLWIGPPWQEPAAGTTPVVIEPGRAFGTGAHATTRLCLELLLERRERGSLLDVGCGSGVLAIAAAKVGFGPVLAVDHEPEAVAATKANSAANEIRVDVRLADALQETLPAADVVVANLGAPEIAALAPNLDCNCLIASGYFDREHLELQTFDLVARRCVDGWAADAYVRTPRAAAGSRAG